MTDVATTEQNPYLDAFERLEAKRDEAPWLRAMRRHGISRFVETGFPTTRDEDWLYSNVKPIEGRLFRPARAVPTPDSSTLAGNLIDIVPGPKLVFVNGHRDKTLSSIEGLPEGVTVGSLRVAMEENGDRVRDALERMERDRPHAFVDLNTAFFADGALIHLGKNVVVDQPIQIDFIMTSWQDGLVENPRVLVVAEPGSNATILVRYDAQGPGDRLTNTVEQFALGANSRIQFVRLQREGSQAFHFGYTDVKQDADSTFQATSVTLGGAICRQEVRADLNGPGAECTLNGLSVLGGKEHVDNHTVIDHHVPHCTSGELYKNILGGHARGAFTGRIVVHPDAQKTDSVQANHNLLLSHDALAETRPQLEIYADDVKCAHGATIGQLDDDQMFYLRSRGLGPMAARNLLIHGFASEVIDRVTNEHIREALEQVLASRLQVDASDS